MGQDGGEEGGGLKVRALPRMLKKDGWELDRPRGDHRQLVHPTKPGTVTVSGPLSDDVHPKTLKSVLRQAGLEADS
jgi:predicted RNA binding protein YcfA (HicA-like mRNA interferase family)